MEGLMTDEPGRLLRIIVVGSLAYATLVLLLRISGARTLSKMNPADFVVTVALGSTLGSVVTDAALSLAEGAVAFALLIGLQYLVTWTSVRYGAIRRIVTGEPVMLVYRGETLMTGMRRARVTDSEIRAALRDAGLGALRQAQSVVLETDGSLSVVPAQPP